MAIAAPTSNSSYSYNQSGTNLSAGTYTYNFSTSGNTNYTSNYINDSFTINQVTTSAPTLTVNGSSSSTNTITNQSVLVNATIPVSINNQITWNINDYYPNGTLVTFTTATASDSNSFSVTNTPT